MFKKINEKWPPGAIQEFYPANLANPVILSSSSVFSVSPW